MTATTRTTSDSAVQDFIRRAFRGGDVGGHA